MARAMPVLPEVGSRILTPGFRWPSRSASSIIRLAMRSFSEPVGFWPSSLAHSLTRGFGESRWMPTSGVLPMVSRMSVERTPRVSQAPPTLPRLGLAVLDRSGPRVLGADVRAEPSVQGVVVRSALQDVVAGASGEVVVAVAGRVSGEGVPEACTLVRWRYEGQHSRRRPCDRPMGS